MCLQKLRMCSRSHSAWAADGPALSGCGAAATCTALLPSQVLQRGKGGAELMLQQQPCFGASGANQPACCEGARCASWAGARAVSDACFTQGVMSLGALSWTGVGEAALVAGGGRHALPWGARAISLARGPGWAALLAEGTLLSNSSADASGTLALELRTATGSSPELQWVSTPPGLGAGAPPARFTVGAGLVLGPDGAPAYNNTLQGATVAVPPARQGSCAPCPREAQRSSVAFTAVPATLGGSLLFQPPASAVFGLPTFQPLSRAAVETALQLNVSLGPLLGCASGLLDPGAAAAVALAAPCSVVVGNSSSATLVTALSSDALSVAGTLGLAHSLSAVPFAVVGGRVEALLLGAAVQWQQAVLDLEATDAVVVSALPVRATCFEFVGACTSQQRAALAAAARAAPGIASFVDRVAQPQRVDEYDQPAAWLLWGGVALAAALLLAAAAIVWRRVRRRRSVDNI